MTRFWISGCALVFTVATLKTFLVAQFVLSPEQANQATISGLFALFTAMTAAVGYIVYDQLNRAYRQQNNVSQAPETSAPVAKETIIMRNAAIWGLSQSEADVAIFVVKGFSNSEIASMRGCAIATIKTQLSSIYRKSGLESRYQLIAYITDEVVAMAKEPEAAETRIATRKILPLVGRSTTRLNDQTLDRARRPQAVGSH